MSRPIATGGNTSGSDTTVSTTALPRNAVRASIQLTATATGITSSVASAAVAPEKSAMLSTL